jgi:hypothetical protein
MSVAIGIAIPRVSGVPEATDNAKFEKLPTVTVTVTEQCDKEHVY